MTREAAATALTSAGLVVGTDTTANSPTVAPGSVIGTTPNAGTQVDAGSTVNLQVSSGPAQVQTPVAVPDVAGMTREAAATALTSAGLAVGTDMEADTVTIAARRVIGTIPNARELVSPGSKINLEISSGHDKSKYIRYGLMSLAFLVFVILGVIGLHNQGFVSLISQDTGAWNHNIPSSFCHNWNSSGVSSFKYHYDG
jgi:beta-lactam-binding protein with PASTA domain